MNSKDNSSVILAEIKDWWGFVVFVGFLEAFFPLFSQPFYEFMDFTNCKA